MFSKTDRKGAANGVPSIISADMNVSGNLLGDGVMQVEGTVDGDIRCAEVTIGRSAQVCGQIECDTVHVHGTVTGEIRAFRRVPVSRATSSMKSFRSRPVPIWKASFCVATRNNPD
jgi:cytoskeletal protein CcmA (bactofilin family)